MNNNNIPQIKLENVSFKYPVSKNESLKNITFSIEKGDFIAVTGENGCGKTTLCKILIGLIPQYITGKISGKIEINGRDILSQSVGEISQQVGYVYQDFENQIICPTVSQDVSYAAINYGLADYEERCRNSLEICGISHLKDRPTWQLSGGQLHMTAISGVLCLSPQIIIIDEPTAQLDTYNAQIVYDLLKEMNLKKNITIIVIEHDLSFIEKYCSKVLRLENSELSFLLPVTEGILMLKKLAQKYYFGIKTNSDSVYEDKIISPVLRINNLNIFHKDVFEKDLTLINNFELDLSIGERLAIIGKNGSGKTTLLRTIAGYHNYAYGEFSIKEGVFNYKEWRKRKKNFIYIPQNPEIMFIKDSIKKDIAFAMGKDYSEDKATKLLEMFGLSELSDMDGRLLSGGQMRKAALAIGLASKPKMLLLDEPTAALDMKSQADVINSLINISDLNIIVIIATHDDLLEKKWAKRIIRLGD